MWKSRALRLVALVWTLGSTSFLTGCPGPTVGSDTGSDTGSDIDTGGTRDGGASDAPTTPDTGSMKDAGTLPDAPMTADAPTPVTYTLTVVITGTGSGTVTSSPVGIDCGVDCAEVFDAGTVVTLTAAPAAGSTFDGWSGAGCGGTGTCVTTITAITAVAATFTLTSVALDVSLAGTGTGTVMSSPAGISCGSDCTESYAFGSVVALTAIPDVGSTFAGWSGGGCTGTGTCTVSMTSATTVTASFTSCTGAITFRYTGAAQTFVVPMCVTSITVDARGASGGDGWNVDGGGSVRGFGGSGGRVQARLTVTGGETLLVYVGGAGMNATPLGPGLGGFNGGGDGADSMFGYSGGGGGGATDLRRGSGLAGRILVAGGGGSGSGWCTSGMGNGGAGGGLTGASGMMCVSIPPGTGGTQSAGGSAGGVLGVGGSTGLVGGQAGAAGGGGYYGGGASDGSGGSGGSSYVTPTGSSAITHTQGVQDGDGTITLSW
jgi:hypothetical protein